MTKITSQKLRAKPDLFWGKSKFLTRGSDIWMMVLNSNSLQSYLSTHLRLDRNIGKGSSFNKGAVKNGVTKVQSNIILLYSFYRRYRLMILNVISLNNSLEIPAGFLRQFQQNKKGKTHWKLTLPLPIKYSFSISFLPQKSMLRTEEIFTTE